MASRGFAFIEERIVPALRSESNAVPLPAPVGCHDGAILLGYENGRFYDVRRIAHKFAHTVGIGLKSETVSIP